MITGCEQKGGEMASRECPNCHSKRNWKRGIRETNFGSVQRYICRDCTVSFSEKSYISYNLSGNSQLCAILEEAKKLDTATEIKTVAGDGKANLIEYAWRLKKRGLQDNTIEGRTHHLERLVKKGADLLNPDSVETVLATENYTKSNKRNAVSAYHSFTKVFKIAWEPIKVKYEPKQQYIPTREELLAIIHASGKRLAAACQVALDTGARVGEICRLKWIDVNTENLTISINDPEKNSCTRTLKVTEKTIALVQALPNNDKYRVRIFNPNPDTLRAGLEKVRKRLANTQNNPRFLQIHFHTFRHYYGSNLYRKTKILGLVQQALGHKSIVNTEIYTKSVLFSGDEKYYSTTAKTVEEICKLAEDGWTYFQEVDGIKIFKKPM